MKQIVTTARWSPVLSAHEDHPRAAADPSQGDAGNAGPRGPNPIRGLGELTSFLAAGVGAIVRFWLPSKNEAEVEADVAAEPPPEPAPSPAAEAIETLVRKITPYPTQEG